MPKKKYRKWNPNTRRYEEFESFEDGEPDVSHEMGIAEEMRKAKAEREGKAYTPSQGDADAPKKPGPSASMPERAAYQKALRDYYRKKYGKSNESPYP